MAPVLRILCWLLLVVGVMTPARAAQQTALRCDAAATQFGRTEPFTVSIRFQPVAPKRSRKGRRRGHKSVRQTGKAWRVSVVGRDALRGRNAGWTLRLAGRLTARAPSVADRTERQRHLREAQCRLELVIAEAVGSGATGSRPVRLAAPAVQAGAHGGRILPGSGTEERFTVDGIRLGERVDFDRPAYRSFACQPSGLREDYRSCTRTIEQPAGQPPGNGPQTKTTRIEIAPDGAARSIALRVEPASFRQGDVERELARLSRVFDTAPQRIRLDGETHDAQTREGLVATWSGVTLTRLDQAAPADLPEGTHAALFDYLGEVAKSARQNLPIYRIGGDAGYIWSALYDRSGKGVLHVVAIDPKAFASTSPPPAPQSAPSSAAPNPRTAVNAPAPAPAQPSAEPPVAPVTQPSAPPQSMPAQPSATEAGAPALCASTGDDQLASLRLQAKQLLDDAARLVEGERAERDLEQYIRGIAALQHALAAGDDGEITTQVSVLRTVLAADPRYVALLAQRSEAERLRTMPLLRRESRSAKRYANFIEDYVRQNPRSTQAVVLLDLRNMLENELAKPKADAHKLQCLNRHASRLLNDQEIAGLFGVRAWIFRLKRAVASIAHHRAE